MNNSALINSGGFVHGLMLLNITLAASSFPVGAEITHALPPEVMMFVRFLLAATLLAPYAFIKNGFSLPEQGSLFYYIVLGIPLAVFFWCMFESLRYTSVLNTGALYTLFPAMTAVYAYFINSEVTSKFRSLGLMIGTVGALWIVFRGDYAAAMSLDLNKGDIVFIIGCIFLGLYNPLIKKFYRGEPMEVMTFWILLSASGWLLLVSGSSILDTHWGSIETKVYGGIIYLAFFSTLVTFFLLQFSIVRIGATKVAAYSFLTPIMVIAISFSLGIDKIELVTIPGIVLVVAAMVIIQRETTQKESVNPG